MNDSTHSIAREQPPCRVIAHGRRKASLPEGVDVECELADRQPEWNGCPVHAIRPRTFTIDYRAASSTAAGGIISTGAGSKPSWCQKSKLSLKPRTSTILPWRMR